MSESAENTPLLCEHDWHKEETVILQVGAKMSQKRSLAENIA